MDSQGNVIKLKDKGYIFPNFLLMFGYAFVVLAGVAGIATTPATSVKNVVGYSVVAMMWNAAFIVAGITGIAARVTGARYVEIVAVDVIGVVLLLWAFVIFASNSNYQAGLAFVGLSLVLFGWANSTRKYLATLASLAGTAKLKED